MEKYLRSVGFSNSEEDRTSTAKAEIEAASSFKWTGILWV